MSAGPYFLDLAAYRQVRAWCRWSPCEEIGGALGGIGRYISHAVKVPNLSVRPARVFEWDERTMREAHRTIKTMGLRVLGHFHSHPNAYGRPSDQDIATQDGLELIWSGIQRRPRLWLLRGTKRQVLRNELDLLVCERLSGAPRCRHGRR